jgi:hypothetical protein
LKEEEERKTVLSHKLRAAPGIFDGAFETVRRRRVFGWFASGGAKGISFLGHTIILGLI